MTNRDEELKRRIAKDLQIEKVDPVIWENLEGLGFLTEAFIPSGYAELLKWYRKLRRSRTSRAAAGRALPGRPIPIPDRLVPLSDQENRRFESLEKWIVNEAGSIPAVKNFRLALFGNTPLTAEDADAFIASKAIATLTVDELADSGVKVLEEIRLVHMADERTEDTWRSVRTFEMGNGGPMREFSNTLPLSIVEALPALRWTDRSGRVSDQLFWHDSVLDYLCTLALALCRYFPWTISDAVRFVITDDPSVDPVLVRSGRKGLPHGIHRGQIEIVADPWVSADTVERTFRFLQRAMLKTSRNQSGDNRSMPVKGLAIFEFVEEQRQGDSDVSFRELARRWNASVKEEWRFAQPLDKFKRAFEEARRNLLMPDMTFIADDPIQDPLTGELGYHFDHMIALRNWGSTMAKLTGRGYICDAPGD